MKTQEYEPPHEQLKRLLETIERETVPMIGHQDPNAIKDCWSMAYDLIEEMLNECSHLAANTCPYSYGDEGGHQRCSEIDKLKKKASKYDELVAIVDKYYEMDDDGEFVNGGDLVDIGEAVAHKLGYL